MIDERTDAELLRLIARDHARLAPNSYHSAETLRQIADRLEASPPAKPAPAPQLLDSDESKALLARAEQLWADLQENNLGGFSGVNRPFYIMNEFRRVIEGFSSRDTGLHWSKDQLDALSTAQGEGA